MAEGRGRRAKQPHEIPARGWRDILLRVKDEISADNISIVAAGIAYYALLAIFPALAAAVSIYGLIADPADVERQLTTLSGVLPQEAQGVLAQQLHHIVSSSGGALSLGLIVGLLFSLWSASSGVKTLMTAMNIVYDEEEKRGFVWYNAQALLLTLGAIVFALLSLTLIVVLPALINGLGLTGIFHTVASLLRWPLLAIIVVLGLGVLYRYGPSRDQPRWQWVSWGAVAAALLWLIGSALFSYYVANFGNYNETYGSIGAVVILLLWFYLTSYVVLLGAEVNSEMEHQTKEDTTVGEPEPMGRRRARMADTVGRRP